MFITTTNQIINVIKKFIVALFFYIILEICNLQDYANMSKFYNNNLMKKFFPISHYDMISFQRTLAQIMTLTRKPHTRIVCQTKQNKTTQKIQNTHQVVQKSGRGIRVNNKWWQSPKIIPIESSNGIILPRP